MSQPFKTLLEKMTPERRTRIKLKTELLKREMALGELRQALKLTQEELANLLKMNQAAISKFEHQSDIYISTLRKILSAMGAELRIVARFPDVDVQIDQFDEIRSEPRTGSGIETRWLISESRARYSNKNRSRGGRAEGP
jgi:transcriptional regulator with XRE-family HTH domain